jgi:hypothetical protein
MGSELWAENSGQLIFVGKKHLKNAVEIKGYLENRIIGTG